MKAVLVIFYFLILTHVSSREQVFPQGSFHRSGNGRFTTRFKRFTAAEAKEQTRFWLYTRRNRQDPVELFENNVSSIKKSPFNFLHPVRIIIHGFLARRDSAVNQLIKDAYLQKGEFNVIVVDWGHLSGHIYEFFLFQDVYYKVAESIVYVGQLVGKFTKFLHDKLQVSFGDMYLIGHSLGAHIAGFAGNTVYPHRYDTIFALDPARPDFEGADPRHMVDNNDAIYVESIHTDANDGVLNGFGLIQRVGRSDFYANYGQSQPGCLMLTCSHSRAYKYFAESINSPIGFWARKCSSMDDILNKNCPTLDTLVTVGGEPSQKNRSGVFYFNTNEHSPFARGAPETPKSAVTFDIYTLSNRREQFKMFPDEEDAIKRISLPAGVSLKIIIGDYDTDSEFASSIVDQIKNTYLATGHPVVVVVDWKRCVSERIYRKEIFADGIAREVAKFTKLINEKYHIPFNDMHLIGEGVGAQIAGFAGHFIAPQKYDSIYALDTAENVLTDGASYVQGIQTNFIKHQGEVTFFFNFDAGALKCSEQRCRHRLACEYFIESLKEETHFAGVKCPSLKSIDLNRCDIQHNWINIGEKARYEPTSGPYFLFQLKIKM